MSDAKQPKGIPIDKTVAAVLADAMCNGHVVAVRVTPDAHVRLDMGHLPAGHRIDLKADTLENWSSDLADAYARFESHRRDHAAKAIAGGESPEHVCAALHAEGVDMAYLIERTHALAIPGAASDESDGEPEMAEYRIGVARTLIETYRVVAPAGLDAEGLNAWVAEHGYGVPVMAVTAPGDDDERYAIRFLDGRPVDDGDDEDATDDTDDTDDVDDGPIVKAFAVGSDGKARPLDDDEADEVLSMLVNNAVNRRSAGVRATVRAGHGVTTGVPADVADALKRLFDGDGDDDADE